ncbi:hypothetical protein R3W88_000458 [Solanum pinnatisectum]|uniref:Jacalin-type lectin domain-containing protein n=1 Tax=Solanum pinnatisectum TaxID=50273 RepID=A0AAV9MFR4_9SOLN|nr:hypothetical protein R3W88_000458 [Solanum pinnatisectum]
MNLIKVGPAGGKKGTVWDEKGKGEIAKVLTIVNIYHPCILKVVLDYPSEFLTSIRGFHDLESPDTFIYLRSITFGTNKDTYGPYGMKTRVNYKLKEFNFEIGDDCTFGGFHGT